MRWRAERRTGPPDFVGVGSHGAPSLGWHRLLQEHPDVVHPRGERKALHFFDEFCARPLEDGDVERYHALFERPEGTLCGEWTGRYMYDHWTPPLLARVAPDAKLIVILADPIGRYRMQVSHKRRVEDMTSAEIYMVDVLSRACYATQLRRLLEHYDRDRILVLQHERCAADPVGEYRRMLRFLELREDAVPRRLRRWRGGDDREMRFPTRVQDVKRTLVQTLKRTGDVPPADLWPDLEESLREELEPEIRELRRLAPEVDLSLWPNFAALAARDGG